MIQVAVCEDQREHMENMIASLNKVKEKWNIWYDMYSSGEQLLQENAVEEYDLFILDIELPGIHGIALAEQIRLKNRKALFMFVTSFDKYRVDAFGLNVVAYITKPLTAEKLDEQLEKNRLYIHGIENYFDFTSDYENVSVKCNEIIYLSKDGRGLSVITDKKSYNCNMTIKDALKKLDTAIFVQSHKSYVVNISRIKMIEDDEVIFKNNMSVQVSRSFKKALQEKHLSFIEEVM